ncbi:HAD-IIA family hydrolase [Citricoccus muralis]|uniref:HAD-IIA family hydrolase n=1 Tax=Citricoccus muralis TaxID=169134 RepID=A0ABY8H386_9MICC|nr:HAD-IIA family hydrolase [Citricoccus muralis]WFP15591.1 HAD-IIA family hydrolase [Citricoccus muralis]
MSATSTFFGGYDGLLCDLDGVVYAGNGAIPGAVDVLNVLISAGVPVAFVTNNASRSPAQVAGHLRALGVMVSDNDQVFGSASAGVELLRQEVPPQGESAGGGPAVLVAGSEHLATLVSEAGYAVTADACTRPAAVIQGFDPSLGWHTLAQASYAIQNGAVWIATNLDLTIPRAEGRAPGNGSLVNAVATACGRRPDLSAGKPEPVMFELAARRWGMTRPLVVGDRLDTDIEGGNRAGFDTALVLTGIHQRTDASEVDELRTPTHIVPSLTDLLDEARTHE